MNEITEKIFTMMASRRWSAYRLEQESGVSAPTIRRWQQSDMYPTIPNIMQVCEAFGITLAEFFLDGDMVELTPDVKELHADWRALTSDEQSAVRAVIKGYTKRKKG